MRYSIVFALLLTLARPALAQDCDQNYSACVAELRSADSDLEAAEQHYFYEREISLGMRSPGQLVDPERKMPEQIKRQQAADATWMARCVLRVDTDDLGVRRYVYKPGAVNCP